MYDVDPEVAEGLAEVFGADPDPGPARGDWQSRRALMHALFADLAKLHPAPDDVTVEDLVINGGAGQPMPVRVYRKTANSVGGAVLLYLHGGGMIMGNLETHDGICRTYASTTGLTVVGVEYRVAPEHPFPAPLDDCFAALCWIASQDGASRGFDGDRVVVGGESAGGGLAAAVALRTRDEGGPRLVGLMLAYPMLDDRSYEEDAELEEHALWRYDDHLTAWSCYLGGKEPDASGYAAPLRASDLSGLPPTYLDCGELDVFRQENLEFVLRLLGTRTRVEMHLHPAVPHAFEVFAPHARVSRRAIADRSRAILSFIGR